MEYPEWLDIRATLGLTVYSIRGHKSRKNAKRIKPEILLFDDGKTYIELEEQDYYSYHDCSCSAREVNVRRSEKLWQMYNGETYAEATEDL